LWRAANLGRSRLLGGQSRLKAGCGQNCPPSTNHTDQHGDFFNCRNEMAAQITILYNAHLKRAYNAGIRLLALERWTTYDEHQR
jgi:hypothetical protein